MANESTLLFENYSSKNQTNTRADVNQYGYFVLFQLVEKVERAKMLN